MFQQGTALSNTARELIYTKCEAEGCKMAGAYLHGYLMRNPEAGVV